MRVAATSLALLALALALPGATSVFDGGGGGGGGGVLDGEADAANDLMPLDWLIGRSLPRHQDESKSQRSASASSSSSSCPALAAPGSDRHETPRPFPPLGDKMVLSPVVLQARLVSRSASYNGLYFASFRVLKVLKVNASTYVAGGGLNLFSFNLEGQYKANKYFWGAKKGAGNLV